MGGVYAPNALSIRNFFLPLNPKIQTDQITKQGEKL